jgi:hypothetical protein
MPEVIEVIYRNRSNGITSKLFKKHEYSELMNTIKELIPQSEQLDIKNRNIKNKILCLDFHGVTDLFNPVEKISYLPTIIISFVGRNSSKRKIVHEEIVARIKSGQVYLGALVFSRTYEAGLVGTKEWIISAIRAITHNQMIYFIDDSDDHIESVRNAKLNNVRSYLVHSKRGVIDIIKQIEESKLGGSVQPTYYDKYLMWKNRYLRLKES